MRVCRHCNGTGVAPDHITLECVGCQRKVSVAYTSTADLMTKCDNIRCPDCKKQDRNNALALQSPPAKVEP